MLTTTEIALKFARLGYHVFPMYRGRNGAKLNPFGWAKNLVQADKADKAIPATDDEKIVSKWPEIVRAKYKSEVAGFGVLGIGCVILDLDVKGNKNGIEEFKILLRKYKIPPPTMMTVSKSGGLHLYYKKPQKLQDSSLKTFSGIKIGDEQYPSIDLRGDGGFVVGPEVLVEDLQTVAKGHYGMVGLSSPSKLPEFPETVMRGWMKSATELDADNLASIPVTDETDFKAFIRRGQIPSFVPKGARNESFFVFISVLKSKGLTIEACRLMCQQLKEKVEEPETFEDSVDIEAMLKKAFETRPDDPYSVASDLIKCGLFQLTGYKSHLHYVILEDNPYIVSRTPHDEQSMKTLLKRFERPYENSKGKSAIVNPISVITKQIGDENRVDLLGFKPRAGEVFSLHDEPGSKKFLNTYRPLKVYGKDFDPIVWSEFMLLIEKLFGSKDSEEFQLGMDFISWLIQYPEIKPSIAPFIMSTKRGVGKSLLFNVIVSIMGTAKDGERQARFVKLDEISGRFFNPSGCIINLIDEVQFPVHKNMRSESTSFWRHLKTLVTAESVPVEIKGGITYQSPNSAAVALAGNFGSFFPIEEFDRRIWIIDANAPLLEMGSVDRLFDLVRRSSLETDDRNRYVDTLRDGLYKWKIKTDLATIRAPMTDVKQEMYENSLTNTEEWFTVHFRDPGNLFAHTPIISMSAMYYVWDRCGRSEDKDTSTFFRDIKRKGFIRPIRLKKESSTSKQFTVPTIGLDGSLMRNDKREVLYTTRNHGEYDATDASVVLDMFHQNCATITRYKQQMMVTKRDKIKEL